MVSWASLIYTFRTARLRLYCSGPVFLRGDGMTSTICLSLSHLMLIMSSDIDMHKSKLTRWPDMS